MTFKVHRNYIFVRPIIEANSKLILPPIFRQSMETARRGVVVHAGPKAFVEPGETIVFDKWTDNPIKINGEQLLTIQPHSVIAVEA